MKNSSKIFFIDFITFFAEKKVDRSIFIAVSEYIIIHVDK